MKTKTYNTRRRQNKTVYLVPTRSRLLSYRNWSKYSCSDVMLLADENLRTLSTTTKHHYPHSKVYILYIAAASRRRAAILDLAKPEIAPFDPPSSKTPPSNQTWSGSEIWSFEIFPNVRSLVVRRSVLNINFLHWSHILLFATLGTQHAKSKQEAQLLLGDRATRKHAKESGNGRENDNLGWMTFKCTSRSSKVAPIES